MEKRPVALKSIIGYRGGLLALDAAGQLWYGELDPDMPMVAWARLNEPKEDAS
jgi:hypothetical protein